jgi:hypothetical protein
MIENGHEVPLPPITTVGNISENSRMLRSGRIIQTIFPRKNDGPSKQQTPAEEAVAKDTGQTSETNINSDSDEVWKLIKKSEYKVVDQLLQTPYC